MIQRTHRNSQRKVHNSQDMHRFKTDKILTLRSESRHSLNQKAVCNWLLLGKLVYQYTDSHSRRRFPTEMDSMLSFVVCLYSFCFICYCVLLGFCLFWLSFLFSGIYFERENVNSIEKKVGKIWKDLGNGKYIIKTYWMKNIFKS